MEDISSSMGESAVVALREDEERRCAAQEEAQEEETPSTCASAPTSSHVIDERLTPPATTVSEVANNNESSSSRSFRLPCASRKTVEDLEMKAQEGDNNNCNKSSAAGTKRSLSRASTTGSSTTTTETTTTQPGAVAMYRSDSDSSSSDNAYYYDSATTASSNRSVDGCCSDFDASATEVEDEIPMIHAQLATITAAGSSAAAGTVIPIQAHLAEEDPPIVAIPQAQLVNPTPPPPPPPEAYHVEFDEEAPPPPPSAPSEMGSNSTAGTAPGEEETTNNSVPRHHHHPRVNKLWKQHGKPCLRFSVLLLIVGLIAALVVPRVHEQRASEDIADRLEWLEGQVGDLLAPTPAPSPQPSAQTVYQCYDSTLQIALAQANTTIKKSIYVLCPNTLIPIGSLNEQNEIVGGDYPLVALGDSIEIRCGIDGRKESQCVLEGGILQVLLQPSLPDLLAGEIVNRTDNVVFRGITFRGDLDDSNENFGGVSVLANNPGDISFIDCVWEGMTAPKGLVQVGDSHDAMTFAPTTAVTFEDCTFSDIVYDGPFIGVYGQEVALRRCLFEGLGLPDTIEPCQVQGEMEWCNGLLYCFERSSCELEDICVQGVEYAGPAAVATAGSQTNLTVLGSKQSFGLKLHPSVISSTIDARCSTGMAQFEDPEYTNPECLMESANWTSTDSCML